MSLLARRTAIGAFLVFAFAYFLSALLRAVTATLAPALTQEFALQASDLGLLAGGYFLGFSATQLPLGQWLDRHGPRKVLLGFLGVAVLGCLVFAQATGFAGLLLGRMLCGAGVSACLMAPLTGFRRWAAPSAQLRVNAWMLMTGSLGMLASTLPVQWLVPVAGWRPLFWGVAALLLLSMLAVAWKVPRWAPAEGGGATTPGGWRGTLAGYGEIWRHPYFRRVAPLGFVIYGGMVAMQALWAGPWMQNVAGYTPLEAATGLFVINLAMLATFWAWGLASPWLLARAGGADPLMAMGLLLPLGVLAGIVAAAEQAGAWAWALYCVLCSVVTVSQPAVAQAFAPALAGRVLSAYNLVIFVGVFAVQWGIGLAVDAAVAAGLETPDAYRLAMAAYLGCSVAAYAWFVAQGRRDNAAQTVIP